MLPLVVLLAPAADPDPPAVPIALPAEVAARPGRVVTLRADTPGKAVRWALAAGDADLVPACPDGRSALFVAPAGGRFVVLAWTAAGDVPSAAARCLVVVAEPPPADPLFAELEALYAADRQPGKAAHLAQLAAVYREAVGFADRADVGTAGDLAGRIRTAVGLVVPADALPAVRKRVAAEVSKFLPDDEAKPLDAATRKTAAELFARIAAALEAAP